LDCHTEKCGRDAHTTAGGTPALQNPTELRSAVNENKKGTAEAVPFCTSGRSRLHLRYEPFTTSRLFCTLNTPKTWLARMPATCLSIGVATVP